MAHIYGYQHVLYNLKFKYFDQLLSHVLKQNVWFWEYGCWSSNKEIIGSRYVGSRTSLKS